MSNADMYNKPSQQLKRVIIALDSHREGAVDEQPQIDRDEVLQERIQRFNQRILDQTARLQKLENERNFLDSLRADLRLHGFNNLVIDYQERLDNINTRIEQQHKQDSEISYLKAKIKEKEEEKVMLQNQVQQMRIQAQALARQYEVEEQVLRSQMSQKTEKRQENIMNKFQLDEQYINDSFARQLKEQEQQLSSLEDKFMELERRFKTNESKIQDKEKQVELLQTETDKVSWERNGASLQLKSAIQVIKMANLDAETTQSRVDVLATLMDDLELLIQKISQSQSDTFMSLNEMNLLTEISENIADFQ